MYLSAMIFFTVWGRGIALVILSWDEHQRDERLAQKCAICHRLVSLAHNVPSGIVTGIMWSRLSFDSFALICFIFIVRLNN